MKKFCYLAGGIKCFDLHFRPICVSAMNGGQCVTELVVGWDSSVDRAHLDHETSCIIIPDDSSPVQADGVLVSWNVFARQPGTVALDVRSVAVLFYVITPHRNA